MFSKAKSGDEGLVTLDPVEPTLPIRQGVYEHADLCEQSHIGHVGKVSRRCYPGGHGCFHLNGLTDTNDAVVASCIGRAEKYVATRDDAFDQYHEALMCLVEEVQGKCHLVHSGIRQMFLCCCKATVIRNNIARCEVDSNMLFNTHEYEVKYVESFKDDY
uniref:DUF19 domain-containing protein n=1 Tax=Panagrellus redivivus TaxID=6233 RepID=A0A7E4VSS1_PANRE